MRDILILGGAGHIGYNLVLSLLDSKYSITVLDLESKHAIKRLDKIKNSIKIVYGDIENYELIESLIKKNDIVIDYAGVMPPLANFNTTIANDTNYKGTLNIVNAINNVNKECSLIYMSFISIYGISNIERKLTINSETETNDLYSKSILKSENYIKDNLKKYTIIRMPIVLTPNNYFIKRMSLNRVMDFISMNDLNNIITALIFNKKSFGKTYNVSGFKMNTKEFVKLLYLKTGELSLTNRFLYYGEYEDDSDINKLVKVGYSDIDTIFKEYKKEFNIFIRIIKKIINLPKYIWFKIRKK